MTDLSALTGELRRHDEDIRDLRKGQDVIVSEMKSISSAVSGVASSLTEMKAQKGPPWHQIISTGTQVVIVIGAIVSGVVYIASNGQSPQQHGFDNRLSRVEWRLDRNDADDAKVRGWIEKADATIKRLDFAAGWKQTVQRD